MDGVARVKGGGHMRAGRTQAGDGSRGSRESEAKTHRTEAQREADMPDDSSPTTGLGESRKGSRKSESRFRELEVHGRSIPG